MTDSVDTILTELVNSVVGSYAGRRPVVTPKAAITRAKERLAAITPAGGVSGQYLYEAFWKRQPDQDKRPAPPWSEQSDAIKTMWDGIAGDATSPTRDEAQAEEPDEDDLEPCYHCGGPGGDGPGDGAFHCRVCDADWSVPPQEAGREG